MASKLQSLLGVAPLENLRKRKPQNQYGMSGQSMFGMDTPINTDFQQIGNQPLAPIRTQAPVQQNYFNTQMNNMGLQDPYSMSLGPDEEDGGRQEGPSAPVCTSRRGLRSILRATGKCRKRIKELRIL